MLYGLTDGRGRLPPGGVLKKGDEKGAKTPGSDRKEAFRFEGKGNPAHIKRIKQTFQQYFGSHPTSLRVQLVYPKASDNFEAWAESYGSGNWLKIRCNRKEQVHYWTGQCYSDEPKPCQYDRATGKCKLGCDEVGRLTVWIPELYRAGFYQPITVQTHSLNDIKDLDEQLKYYDTLTDDIRGVTFTLQRKPEEHFRPGFDKQGNRTDARGKMTSWLIELVPPVHWLEQQLTLIALERELPEAASEVTPTALGKPPAVGYEENEAEVRAGELCQITGCPWKNLQALARAEFKKRVRELGEDEYRKLRSLVFLQWAEMDYGLSRTELIETLREFLGSAGKTDDAQLFSEWKIRVQRLAAERRLDIV